ncbi:MAG: hypothetical protein ACR2F0_06170 [Chthoniobacterales bacterium]
MKTKIALSLLLTAGLLSSCTTTKTATTTATSRSSYANYAAGEEPPPPAEGPEADIPTEGPANPNANPAYVPTPLLRRSAASSP